MPDTLRVRLSASRSRTLHNEPVDDRRFSIPRPHRRAIVAAAMVAIAAGGTSVAMTSSALADTAALPPTDVTTMINQFANTDAAVQLLPSAAASASAASVSRWRIHPRRFRRHSLRSELARAADSTTAPGQVDATTTGATDENAVLSSDASAAQYTEAVSGFSWDAANTDVSGATVLSQSSTEMQVQATVTDTFHITGAADDQSPNDISIASDPYLFTFVQAVGGSWQLSAMTRQETPLSAAASTTANTSGPGLATAARANRGSARHSHRFQHRSPIVASARIIRHHKALSHAAAASYNRGAAFNYAWYWWNGRNPAFPSYRDDCQNFASQVINAGGVTRSVWDTWNPRGWEWDNVDGFEWWVNNAGGPLNYLHYVSNLQQGDVLHLHGPNNARHAMVVLSNNRGNPLLAGHTNNRWNYPFSTVAATNPGYSYYAMHVHGTGRG